MAEVIAPPDAQAILGDAGQVDLSGLEDMAKGEFNREVKTRMPRDYVTMYHPDGTSSVIQLPPLPKEGLPQGKVIQERQQKVMHLVLNKKRAGKQWFFASPPPGWKPADLPWRCPVETCTRAGGLPDLLNLYRHIEQKHPGEKEIYQGVLTAIKEKLAQAIPADLQALLASTDQPVISDGDKAAAEAELAFSEPAVPDDTFVPRCTRCEKTAPEGHANPEAWLRGHMLGAHKEES